MQPKDFGADEFRGALNLTPERFERFAIYHGLLVKWQQKINLISSNTLEDVWFRHFYDSAQILQYFPNDARVIADLGSGAGFPGMVLKILNPELNMNLVESDERKCLFLRTVSRETGLHVSIHNERIERVSDSFVPDVVTARALSALHRLIEFSSVWNRKNKKLQLILLKGETADQEVGEARKIFDFKVDSYPSATRSSARVLRVSEVGCA
ncbi:MAG: 16S rRNA (guanine(527)-N(7))-methyltransferase RsmG [Alphaproteobacteria bacterium]|nr:16S rRNA (guanine(527)-N(7))-methyltransferase RsmG [Alphaproteobacteria bacterium]MCB9975096.1 16S rRNA (guanine(527)-N(7))-methyltransferase RsmG [Rhodospirillales bacterium]